MMNENAAKYVRRSMLGATYVKRIGRLPGGLHLVKALQQSPLTAHAYKALVGFYRPFASLREANEALAPYANEGHENPIGTELHLGLNESARPSDYAAMFHMQPLFQAGSRIFDLGGNVGNLFYCYSKYIEIPPELIWQVHDLGPVIAFGKELADTRGARQLAFTESWEDASGADLLLASGSLHYFERPLPQMIGELPAKPRYILVNRTPFTEGTSVAAVQDGPAYRVACMLYNREDMIRGFENAGYELVDTWQAAELSLSVAGYPEHSVPAYSGFFLRSRDNTPAGEREQ